MGEVMKGVSRAEKSRLERASVPESSEKRLAQLAIRAGLLPACEQREAHQPNLLRILAYHRIGNPGENAGELDPGLISANPEALAKQMRFLVDSYRPVSVKELLEALAGLHPLPPRAVLVTFDDGYRDFQTYAWPVLRSLGIPAVLFVATDTAAGRQSMFWWDRLYQAIIRTARPELALPGLGCWRLKTLDQRRQAFQEARHALERMEYHASRQTLEALIQHLEVTPELSVPLLGWAELREMSAEGLAVCAHSRSHPVLSRLSLAEARQEVVESQREIESAMNRAWPIFAYPVGHAEHLRPELNKILQEAGFRAAVTMIESHNRIGRTDPLRLGRVGLAAHLSLDEFRLTLTGIYSLYGWVKRRRSKINTCRTL
jgi:peptidoglycan/xylan/chitin deacetylase (PgdA/CDA1 family)